ncbi:MAG: hypothetical protein ABI406_07960, partial [Ktedonobacteraceae bacterium]
MSTQSILARLHKNAIYMMVSLLGGLLISLQLVLPATTFAASPRAPLSGYTFGNSQAMDLASVAVVRLVVSTAPKAPAMPTPCATGLGVIASSNATSSTGNSTPQGPYLNTVLTDGSLLTCATNATSASITIYTNAAYTNNTTINVILATLTCGNTFKTCETTSTTSATTTFPTT